MGYFNCPSPIREAGLSNPAVPGQRGLITPPPEWGWEILKTLSFSSVKNMTPEKVE